MANDIFAAIERWLQNRFSVELETGEVISVGNLNAQVAIGGSASGQPCSFNNDLLLQRGDSVLLVRSKRNQSWVIASVIGRTRAGSSVISRPTPTNVPGMPRTAAVNIQSVTNSSWSGTALTTLLAATVNFTGGTPVLLLNGYAAPGASDVNLEIGWGEDLDNVMTFKATLKSTTPFTQIRIFDVGLKTLVGAHTFSVRGQLSAGSITPTLTYTKFAILEI